MSEKLTKGLLKALIAYIDFMVVCNMGNPQDTAVRQNLLGDITKELEKL